MSKPTNDNPDTYPALGRALLWVDKPGSANKIFWALAVVSLASFLADFTYKKYGFFAVESVPGFFAVFGFVAFTALILLVKLLRLLVKRPEDYYADKAIDTEDYPADQLDVVDYDA
jgi:hypothetical protein